MYLFSGVHVYQWDRSGRRDIEQSPWALKKAFKEYSRPLITKRMEIEANILKKMDHPNIVGFRAYMKSDTGRAVIICVLKLLIFFIYLFS